MTNLLSLQHSLFIFYQFRRCLLQKLTTQEMEISSKPHWAYTEKQDGGYKVSCLVLSKEHLIIPIDCASTTSSGAHLN